MSDRDEEKIRMSGEGYADSPISHPWVVPEQEVADFGGFAWTEDHGIVVALGDRGGLGRDFLRRARREV
jgi:hypothetical protein